MYAVIHFYCTAFFLYIAKFSIGELCHLFMLHSDVFGLYCA